MGGSPLPPRKGGERTRRGKRVRVQAVRSVSAHFVCGQRDLPPSGLWERHGPQGAPRRGQRLSVRAVPSGDMHGRRCVRAVPRGTFAPGWGGRLHSAYRPCPWGTFLPTQGAAAAATCRARPSGHVMLCPGSSTVDSCVRCPHRTEADPAALRCVSCVPPLAPAAARNGTGCGPCPAGTVPRCLPTTSSAGFAYVNVTFRPYATGTVQDGTACA